MAYVWDQNLTDDENRQREQQAGGAGIIGAGGAAASMPAGAQPGGGASSASGSFTNLQRYLDENKAGAVDLGQKVAGQVTEAGQAAKTAAEGVVQQGQQQVEAARVPLTGVVEEAAASPTAVAADAAKKADFLRQRDAAYTGPQGLEDLEGFQTAQGAIKKYQDRNDLTKTEAGRTSLLQEMGGPGYGRGKAVLNQLLLSGNPEAGQAVQSAADQFGDLQAYLSGKSDETRARAASATEEAAATKAAVAQRFTGEGGVIPSFVAQDPRTREYLAGVDIPEAFPGIRDPEQQKAALNDLMGQTFANLPDTPKNRLLVEQTNRVLRAYVNLDEPPEQKAMEVRAILESMFYQADK